VWTPDPAIRHPTSTRHQAIGDLADQQHGRVTHRQLREIGMSASAIHRWVGNGHLRPEHRGVYAVGHRATGYLGRWMSGVLACGPGAVLSHHNAAAHLNLRKMSSAAIHVTTPRRPRIEGVVAHRVRSLHPDDCAIVESIPVTSVARTHLDMAETLALRQMIRVIEQAERIGVFDLNAIHAVMARSHGRHGVKPLQRALAAIQGEPPRTNSEWERDFLDFCVDFYIPRPEMNVIVEGHEVDAFWREEKVIVELDSYEFHRARSAFHADRAKLCALQLAGYRVLPITVLNAHTAHVIRSTLAMTWTAAM
jgi:hypothetical protein